MNKQEFNEWLKKAGPVECIYSEYDESGNCWSTWIFKYEKRLYKVEFIDDEIIEQDINGEHSYPQEVIKKTKMVEEVSYENVEKSETTDGKNNE